MPVVRSHIVIVFSVAQASCTPPEDQDRCRIGPSCLESLCLSLTPGGRSLSVFLDGFTLLFDAGLGDFMIRATCELGYSEETGITLSSKLFTVNNELEH